MDEPGITTGPIESIPTLQKIAETGILPAAPLAGVYPYSTESTLQRDREHLDVLATFHYILCGLGCFNLLFLPPTAVFTYFYFCTGTFMPGPSPFPPEFGYALLGLTGVSFVMNAVWAVLLGLTARDLRLRKNRMFCFVVACIHCIHMPVGTVLGVFTIMVLMRDSVKELFRTGDPRPAPEEGGERIHSPATRNKDRQWLAALSICHFVLAALMGLFGMLGGVYILLGVMFLSLPMPPPRPGQPPPPNPVAMGYMMIGMGAFLIVLMFSQAIMAVLTGQNIRKRTRWKLCLVGSGVECMGGLLGVALCVFTVIVLMRQSVRDLFKYGEPPPSPDAALDEDHPY